MDLTVRFATKTCCVSSCGITWAQPEIYDTQKRQDHTFFHCPNGHSQYYVEKSELEGARHELAQTKEQLFRVKACAETKKHRIAALKGVITKMKKRG
jgi:hypothetical protein